MTTSEMLDRLRAASQRPAAMLPPAGAVSLAVGDPDFATPEVIIDTAVDAVRGGYTHYPDWLGDPDLRRAVVDVENQRSVRDYGFESAVIGHGANGILATAILAVVSSGDRVVIPEPTYSLYNDLVAMAGGVVVDVALTAELHLDLEAIAAALPGARLLILCNPGNPTGAVIPRDELQAVAKLATAHDVLVIVDEAYGDLVYDGVDFARATTIDGWHDRLISCQTLSKTFAMTGWRIGYALAPEWVATGMRQINATFNGALNAVVQRAAITALREGAGLAADMMVEYKRRRTRMLEWIGRIDGLDARVPEGAFYVFARYSASISSMELTNLLLSHGVAVRPGREYGPDGEGYIRLSFATDLDTIDIGMERVKTTIEGL